MILGMCAVLLIVGLLLRRWRWRRTGASVLWLSVLLLLLAACGPLPRWLLSGLQAPYATRTAADWAQRNAIVLLGAGTERAGADLEPGLFAYGRISVAAELYRSCHTAERDCKVLISGGDPQKHGIAEAVVYGKELERLGVPASDQIIESKSLSTWQNAQFSRPLLDGYQPERAWLVSSGLHLRRSLIYFAHFGMHPEPVRGDFVAATLDAWPSAWNLALTDAALHEHVGIWRYDVYNVLGWNPPAIK
jgi:uncharacterized SAM-binding protein YcdF (DUF218 family)